VTIHRLGFLGVRVGDPARFAATVEFYRDLLELPVIAEAADRFVWFRLADGTQVHVYGPLDEDHLAFGESPCVGFVVDDVHETRALLEAAGIEFLWETQHDGDVAWAHYRGPDGAIYELIGADQRVRGDPGWGSRA
jgi:catechol 2,3-dioxygenase-like lactoylglutathione lyase family enzyme